MSEKQLNNIKAFKKRSFESAIIKIADDTKLTIEEKNKLINQKKSQMKALLG